MKNTCRLLGYFGFLLILLLACVSAHAQTTNITLQVTDTNGQVWGGGSWQTTLVTLPGQNPFGPPFFNIGTTTPVPNQNQSGTLSATGSATMTLTQNAGVAPFGSQWKFVVCPVVSSLTGCYTQFVTITVVTTVTFNPPAPLTSIPITAESFGALPGGSAVTNTSAIQNALIAGSNIGGTVTLNRCGTYQISSHLTIFSNTYFLRAPCVTIQLAPGVVDNVIVNQAYANRGWVSSGPSYVSGLSACTNGIQTVTFTNGGGTIAATGTITVSGNVPVGQVTMLPPGGLFYQSVPTTGTVATCTGTGTFTGGAITGSATAVTLTWTAGLTMSVAWTNCCGVGGPVQLGNYIVIMGSAPSMFNGVFGISSITDSNDFVVNLLRLPTTTPSGSPAAIVADKNITIEGGIFDYNSQTCSGNVNCDAVNISFTDNTRLERVIANNATKYSFALGGNRDLFTNGVGAVVTNSDVIKVHGPSYNVRLIHTFAGKNGDDGISFDVKAAAAFSQHMWTFGDIQNAVADGVDIDANASASAMAAVYCSVNEYMGGITIKNVAGRSTLSALAAVIGDYNNALCDDIHFENLNGAGKDALIVFSTTAQPFTVSSLDVRGIQFTPLSSVAGTQNQPVILSSNATVNKLTISDLNWNNTNVPSSGGALQSIQSSGTITELNWRNSTVNGPGGANPSRGIELTSGSNTSKVNIDGLTQLTGDQVIAVDSGATGTPLISITNSNLGSTAVAVCQASCNLYVAGNQLNIGGNGVARVNNAVTVNLTSVGNKFLATAPWFTIVGGGPTVNFFDLGNPGTTATIPLGVTLVADGHSVKGTGTGTCSSSLTIGLYGTGPNATTTTCTSTTIGSGIQVTGARTLQNLIVTSSANGTATAAVTVLRNGSTTTLTCSLNGVSSCVDNTHTVALTDGDLISLQIVTGAAETAANIKAIVEWN